MSRKSSPPRQLKGILVDPVKREISEVTVADDFKAFYALLDCTIVQRVSLTKLEVLWLDEEGLLKPDPALFMVAGGALAGRALILGQTLDGSNRDTHMNLDVARALIKWPDLRFTGMTDDSAQHGDVFVLRRRANFEPR